MGAAAARPRSTGRITRLVQPAGGRRWPQQPVGQFWVTGLGGGVPVATRAVGVRDRQKCTGRSHVQLGPGNSHHTALPSRPWHPGFISVERHADVPEPERAEYQASIPVGRLYDSMGFQEVDRLWSFSRRQSTG